MQLPPHFVYNICHSFPAEAERFLAELPSLLQEAARRWELTLGEPFLLSYNYVCAASRGDGKQVVLKIGIPNPELTSEIEALRLYDGQGAARLIATDAEKGLLLQERLKPGRMLLEIADDVQATEIAAGVMRSLWRPAPEPNHFIRLKDWFAAFKELRGRYGGGNGPIPQQMLENAEGLVADFFAEGEPPVVLHGDCHHYNILQAGETWKVIDPKGVIGPRGYEVGPLLINPLGDFLHGPDAKRISERRIAILSEQLGMERARVRGWGIAHATLSACWDVDDQGNGGEHAMHCAKVLMSIS